MTKIVCRHCRTGQGEDPARCADCGSTEFDEVRADAKSSGTAKRAAPRKRTAPARKPKGRK